MKNLIYIITTIILSVLFLSVTAQEKGVVPDSLMRQVIGQEDTTIYRTTPFDRSLLVVTPPVPPIDTNPRVVLWVHGLGGNGQSLIKAASASEDPQYNVPGFKARRIVSQPVDYSHFTKAGLSAAAIEIDSRIALAMNRVDTSKSPMDKWFIIAHSQGGMVTRALQYKDYCDGSPNPGRYGGFVTVGSPHGGAQILNNYNLLLNTLDDGCVTLTKAKYGSVLSYVDKALSILSPGSAGTVQDKLCEQITQKVLPNLFDHFTDSITNEFKVGSPIVAKLATCAPKNLSRVAFYGTETQSQIFWRAVNAFATAPNDFGYWGANDDLDVYRKTVVPSITGFKTKLHQLTAKLGHLENFAPFSFSKIKETKEEMQNVRDAIRWFDDMNWKWQVIMGTQKTAVIPVHKVCVCSNLITMQHSRTIIPLNSSCASPSPICSEFTIFKRQTTIEPSDAVVSVSTQIALPGLTYPPVEMKGSNHMQMRNDVNFKLNLTRLYDGDYGHFFGTLKK